MGDEVLLDVLGAVNLDQILEDGPGSFGSKTEILVFHPFFVQNIIYYQSATLCTNKGHIEG